MFGIVCYSNYHNKALSKEVVQDGSRQVQRWPIASLWSWRTEERARGPTGSVQVLGPENAGTRGERGQRTGGQGGKWNADSDLRSA